jgi:hypothetical protein
MPQKITKGLLIFLLVVTCLASCTLFTFLPFRSLNTGLVYKGF